MLNRELLRFRRVGGKVHIQFIDATDAKLLDLAAGLIALCADAAQNHLNTGDLEELLLMQSRRIRDNKLAKGLCKLLLDRMSVEPDEATDFAALREKLFLASAKALPACGADITQYRATLSQDRFFRQDIYGDLPELAPLSEFKAVSPRELLERYNLALVQGLLVYTDSLELDAQDGEAAELRKLFKYLKFFRLLAETGRLPSGGLHFSISGPLSLLLNTRKYALQLAAFFPAAVTLKKWHICAMLRFSGETSTKLELDQTCGLVSHYRNFSSYVPEEIRLFHRLFAQSDTGWKIVGDTPFIDGPGGEVIFPDFSFERERDHRRLHLELFHRWHRGQLEKRLDFLSRSPKLPLLLGIDRALADDDEFERITKHFPAISGHLLRFRDFPGVERTAKLLDQFCK
ncbi:MAG: DUF790 family protein [Victivallaceae bacterium]|nr:DUF790 family protein [Victivallaceae bacterium]